MRLKYQFDIARFDSPWRDALRRGLAERGERRPGSPYHSVRAHATLVSLASTARVSVVCPTRVCELSTCPSVAYSLYVLCKSRQDSGEEPWAGAGVRHGRRRPWFGPWRRQPSGELSFVLIDSYQHRWRGNSAASFAVIMRINEHFLPSFLISSGSCFHMR